MSIFSWNENAKADLSSYFSWLEELYHENDPFWMTGADPSPVDRKNLKMISNVEKTDKKNYEAVFNFNGIKEAIVSRRGPVLEIYKHWIVTILFYD